MKTINENEFTELLKKESLIVVDFSATWCMPCRMLKPIMDRVESKITEVEFYNSDMEESEEVAKRYRIFSVPTLVAFRNGKKVDSMVGLNSNDDIIDFVNRCKIAEVKDED